MSDSVEAVMRSNLLDVFNERDETKRRAAIERTYADDVRWTDAEGVTTGKQALEAKCVALQKALGAQQFIVDGPVHQLPGFGHLAWQLVDPADGQPRMTGFDVAIVTDGLIAELFTVLIPPTS